MKLVKTEAGYGVPVQGLPFLGTTYSAAISTASTTFSTDFTSDAVRVVAAMANWDFGMSRMDKGL